MSGPDKDLFGNVSWHDADGNYHRDGGPALIETDGSKLWFRHGELHRIDGPAVMSANGYNAWFQNGKRHRLDGPAVEFSYGESTSYVRYWYVYGKEIACNAQEEFDRLVKLMILWE